MSNKSNKYLYEIIVQTNTESEQISLQKCIEKETR